MTSLARELELMNPTNRSHRRCVIGKVMSVAAIVMVEIPQVALASDADRWPIARAPMLELQPLPDEAFADPVAFCRGVLFAIQPNRGAPRGDAITIMASNGGATCFEDGRASIMRSNVENSTAAERPKQK